MLSDKTKEYIQSKIFSALPVSIKLYYNVWTYVVIRKMQYIPGKETKKTHLERVHSSMLTGTTIWATETVEFTK